MYLISLVSHAFLVGMTMYFTYSAGILRAQGYKKKSNVYYYTGFASVIGLIIFGYYD